MIYRLLFLAALLGIANAAESCYNCAAAPPSAAFGPKCSDGPVVKTCSEQTGGVTTTGLCVTRWMNQNLFAQGCMPGQVDGNAMPDNFEQCGAYKCMTEGSEKICVCTSDNCNKDNTFPTNCGAQASEPENGADGKVSLPNKIIIILPSFALLLRVFGFSAFLFLSHLGWRSVLDPPLCHPRHHLLKQLNSLTSTLESVTEHKHRFPFIF